MKKALLGSFAVVAVIVVGIFLYVVGTYNGIVKSAQDADGAWSQVDNVYQRRADLVPNLVATVKGYASHEEKVFTEIAEARASVGQIKIDASQLAAGQVTNEQLQSFVNAQQQLGSALSRLLVVSENYPQLKADALFLKLQDELAGTENRIAVERKRYIETTRTYNGYIVGFFSSMVANKYGFQKRPYFEAKEGSAEAPKVSF